MKTIILFLFSFVLFAIAQTFGQTGTKPNLGNGTSGNPYQIANLDNLIWLSLQNGTTDSSNGNANYWSEYYVQTNNIDVSSIPNWTPIGNFTNNFTGSYNGQSYTISGLIINSDSDFVGLFGFTSSNSNISNLGVVNVNINTTGGYAGGLIGRGSSFVTNCYATGSVNGKSFVGGLIGSFYGTMNTSYSSCSVSGADYCGGLIGNNNGDLANCYSLGSVTRSLSATGINFGSFLGYATSCNITDCYATGSVTFSGATNPTANGFVGTDGGSTTYTNNFFDINTTGQNTGNGATGETTTAMKTQSTFTNWDFINTWQIIGTNYPDLKSNSNSALPVELTTFSAVVNGNTVELSWQTATETNNYGFNIMRRTGTQNWAQIGFVKGSGNSNSPKQYSFVDANPVSGSVEYQLQQIDNDGSIHNSNIVNLVSTASKFLLGQNYPNPFNPTTTIQYSIPKSEHVTLKIYDEIGREVATLVNENQEAGQYNAVFNGAKLASGIYFYRITAGNFSQVKKLLLLK